MSHSEDEFMISKHQYKFFQSELILSKFSKLTHHKFSKLTICDYDFNYSLMNKNSKSRMFAYFNVDGMSKRTFIVYLRIYNV